MVDASLQRGISPQFVQQLLPDGILNPILERVRHDDTLGLEIRNGHIEIYYRGTRILGIYEQPGGERFETKSDESYFGEDVEYRLTRRRKPRHTITDVEHARAWANALPDYKQATDVRLALHPKLEREYRQQVMRDNSRHATGEVSDYLIVDVDYAQPAQLFAEQEPAYRFDMIGFRWPAAGHARGSGVVTPVIIEMKVGDAALASRPTALDSADTLPGLAKRVRDIERFLTPKPRKSTSKPYELMCRELRSVFETKRQLGLPSVPRRMADLEIAEISRRPEVLFVIANHQPSSTILARELREIPPRKRADYYIATVSYAGYGLFADNMKPLDDCIGQLP
ncbi:MAG: hypothetical protein JXA36_00610 [Coriobacteriia bacterium]|nr:hypothetical protein [Coriobacteriia bacterium]